LVFVAEFAGVARFGEGFHVLGQSLGDGFAVFEFGVDLADLPSPERVAVAAI